MVKDRSVSARGVVLLRVIGKERKHWLRLKAAADAQLAALDHAETAFTTSLGRQPAEGREIQDAPQPA